jgi:flagellin-like protein
MLNKKVLTSRKAISPILATLLLIVIAVAAIVVTYAWIMTYMGSATQQAGVVMFKENVFWNATEKKTIITIGNSGTSNAKVVHLYIGSSSNNLLDVTASTDISSGKILYAKQTITITLSWPNSLADSWTSESNYYFKVSNDVGQDLPFAEQAP